jgi:uncharacterized membrane-anchored protein YitT (DUF2179 family)
LIEIGPLIFFFNPVILFCFFVVFISAWTIAFVLQLHWAVLTLSLLLSFEHDNSIVIESYAKSVKSRAERNRSLWSGLTLFFS